MCKRAQGHQAQPDIQIPQENFGFNEYALRALATGHNKAAEFSDQLRAHETQIPATSVWKGVPEHGFGKQAAHAGTLAKQVPELGYLIQTEKLSYDAIQHNFGRSVKNLAPAAIIQPLFHKAGSAG